MITLIVEMPEKAVDALIDLVEQLGGKVIDANDDVEQSKAQKKEQVLTDLEKSIKFVKQHQEGKVEAKSIDRLLDEL